jgi:hypothetical protein
VFFFLPILLGCLLLYGAAPALRELMGLIAFLLLLAFAATPTAHQLRAIRFREAASSLEAEHQAHDGPLPPGEGDGP